jgi:hypothetical protein
MDENLIPESKPLGFMTDEQVRAAFDANFSGTRGHAEGRAVRMNPLRDAFAEAGRAHPPVYQQGSGADAKFIRMPGEAASGARINLADLLANSVQADNVLGVNAVDAGQSMTIDPVATITAHSVAIQQGVRLVLQHPRDRAIAINGERTNGLLGFFRDPSLVRRTLPVVFGDVADGAAAAAQPLPFKDASYEFGDAPSAAFSVTVTRAQDRAVGGGDALWSALLEAILGGLGQYVDRLVLAAMKAANPTAFDFSKAAAQFLQESDLAGVTNGVAATYRGDGKFVVSPGIPAMLSAQADAAYVYAPRTLVAALWPDVDVRVSRLNTQGDATVTVFASGKAIVPDANVVWTVA